MGLKIITRVKMQRWLRKTRLLAQAEKINFVLKKIKLRKSNKEFLRKNPDFKLPPDILAFDAYSAPDWNYYKTGGEANARLIAEVIEEFSVDDKPVESIYEWGCGPGRIIRHLPGILGDAVQVYGSDYNWETIDWCQNYIPGVEFFLNELTPPITKPDQSFDFIYAISVFTHLSEDNCLQWSDELYRLLKSSGLLLITTKGDATSKGEMVKAEHIEYQEKGVLVRGHYEEGKKMYLTRHSPHYVRERLLDRYEIIKHVPNAFPYVGQDFWIARKKEN